jgi:hypothetical protein
VTADCLQGSGQHQRVRTSRISRASTNLTWAMHRGVRRIGRWLTALAELNFRGRRTEEEEDEIIALEMVAAAGAASPVKRPDSSLGCVHALGAWLTCLKDSCGGCEGCQNPAGPVAEGRGVGGGRELGAVSGTFNSFLGIDDVAAGLAAAADVDPGTDLGTDPGAAGPSGFVLANTSHLGPWSRPNPAASGKPFSSLEARTNPFAVHRSTGSCSSMAAVAVMPPQPPSRGLLGLTPSPAPAMHHVKSGRVALIAQAESDRYVAHTNPISADPLASPSSTSGSSSPRAIPNRTATPNPHLRQHPHTTPSRSAPPPPHPDPRTPLPIPRPGSSSGCSPASHICRARLASLHRLSRSNSKRTDRPPRSHSLGSVALQLPASIPDWCAALSSHTWTSLLPLPILTPGRLRGYGMFSIRRTLSVFP